MAKSWKRLYEPKEEETVTPKQRAKFVVCYVMLHNENFTRQGCFELSQKYLKEKNLENLLTEEEVLNIIDDIIASYILNGTYVMDKDGVLRRPENIKTE